MNDRLFGQGQETEMAVGDTILIATHNRKVRQQSFANSLKLGYKVENLNDYPDLPEVQEDWNYL